MTSEKTKNLFYPDKEILKARKNERLTCCNCKNQTFLLIFGVADFPFFDCVCSKCGSCYSRVGK